MPTLKPGSALVCVCVCVCVCLRPSPASVDPPRVACAQVGVRLVLDDGTGPQPVGVGFAGEVRWGPQVQSIRPKPLATDYAECCRGRALRRCHSPLSPSARSLAA